MRPLRLTELDALGNEGKRASKKLATDPECKALYDEITCWVSPATACSDYLAGQKLDPAYAKLFDAYFRWPTTTAVSWDWQSIASEVSYARGLPGEDRLELGALMASYKTMPCSDNEFIARILVAVRRLHAEQHDRALDRQLETLDAKLDMLLKSKSAEVCEHLDRSLPN
jgi:hypothetical protein